MSGFHSITTVFLIQPIRVSRSHSRSRSRSRGRKRKESRSESSSSSRSSSSSESDSAPKKKKKKKEKKHKKKKKGSAKKKKKDASSDSDAEEGAEKSDWREELLKKMKEIKSLPPEQLETEFKKAMAEKKRKEEEEKCINEIKNRQRLARKVKKESEKALKRAEKEEKKRVKAESEEMGNDGFYNGVSGMMDTMVKMEEEENKFLFHQHMENQFKSSFAEVPFVPEEGHTGQTDGMEGQVGESGEQPQPQEGEEDPYTRALQEQLCKEPREDNGEEVSWPAGAIENAMAETGYEYETKEQMDAAQEEMEMENSNMDDKARNVVSTSKLFGKIRNRIKGKPLKIHLKTNKLSTEEDEGVGLQPVEQGDSLLGEPISGEELNYGDNSGYYDGVAGGAGDEYDLRESRPSGRADTLGDDDEEERRVARYRERARKRRERSAREAGELEDGEHSPSPEPERPHHRRRRKRRHDRESRGRDPAPPGSHPAQPGLEEGEIGAEMEPEFERGRGGQRYSAPVPGLPSLPFVDTSVPPPGLGPSPPSLGFPPLERPPPFTPVATPPPVSSYYPGRQETHQPRYNAYQGPGPQHRPPPQPVQHHRPIQPQPRPQPSYFDSLPVHPRPADHLEAIESDEEDAVDITKVSPIMKYIAGKLQELKYHLELEGPFRYRSDIPGLSKHLFVAYKMVTMLEGAGYDNSKMYMSAMFPQGMADTKAELVSMVTQGKLDEKIQGSRLTKMCIRCIRCFLAYYTGKNNDIDTSEGECSEEEVGGQTGEEETGKKTARVKTVNTSLMDVLGRIKDEGSEPPAQEDPLSSVLHSQEPAQVQTPR